MTKNLARWDRAARAVVALVLLVGAAMAPVPVAVRVMLALTAVYVAGTALAGTCLGYRLLGKSTCPVER